MLNHQKIKNRLGILQFISRNKLKRQEGMSILEFGLYSLGVLALIVIIFLAFGIVSRQTQANGYYVALQSAVSTTSANINSYVLQPEADMTGQDAATWLIDNGFREALMAQVKPLFKKGDLVTVIKVAELPTTTTGGRTSLSGPGVVVTFPTTKIGPDICASMVNTPQSLGSDQRSQITCSMGSKLPTIRIAVSDSRFGADPKS
jgi:hypothetical protein